LYGVSQLVEPASVRLVAALPICCRSTTEGLVGRRDPDTNLAAADRRQRLKRHDFPG
jgi:hypothetical protein